MALCEICGSPMTDKDTRDDVCRACVGSVHLSLNVLEPGPYLCERAQLQLIDHRFPSINHVPVFNDRLIDHQLACPWCLEHRHLRSA